MFAVYENNIVVSPALAAQIATLGVSLSKVSIKGHVLDAMPYTLDATRLIQNLGGAMASPIAKHYPFPGMFKPYVHQIKTADFLVRNDKAFCLNGMGTGKTASAIWAADYMRLEGAISKVLVLCPLSCIEAVWADELFRVNPTLRVAPLVGDKRAKLAMLADPKVQWVIANHDAVSYLESPLIRAKFDLVIIDEATAFKSEGAARTKAMKRVVQGKKIWLMTGTPIPQNPVDAYLLCKLVNPDAPQSEAMFKTMTMTRVSQFKWVPLANASLTVEHFMKPAVRFSKEDCLDIPPVQRIDHRVPLTPQQQLMLDDMKNDWMTDRTNAGVEVTGSTAAIRINKMMQILQGIIIDDDGHVHEVDSQPRTDAVLDLIGQSTGKTLVFGTYTGGIAKLTRDTRKVLGKNAVECVDGTVSQGRRGAIFDRFQNDPTLRVLIAHPRVAAHGLTLTAATTTVWYGPSVSGEHDEQANNRMNRPGQKHEMLIVNLWSNRQEKEVYAGLNAKANMQQVLLDIVKRESSI